jgi:hypothetical protein
MKVIDKPPTLPEYGDYVATLRFEAPEIAVDVADFGGIGQVLNWMVQRGRTRVPVDTVGQDEFEYDFLMELEPGGRWLVFGVT